MAPPVLSAPRMVVRTLQAVCGLVAMIFTSLGYIKFTSGQLSSASAIYTTIACYSALVCGLYYVMALRVLKLTATAPKVLYQRGVDAVLFVALLVAGIVHATSEAVKDCTSYNTMFETYHGSALFRCGDMTVAIMLTFVTSFLFLATLVWSFVRDSWKSVKGEGLQDALAGDDANATANGYVVAATPGKKDGSSEAASVEADLDARHPSLKVARCSGRTLQFACSVVAFVSTIAGFKHYYTGQYTSPVATYMILMTYSGVLYSLWHMAAVETLKLSRRPSVGVERAVDAVLAAALLVAGILFCSSSQVKDCSASNAAFEMYHGSALFRCGSMNLGYVFSFITTALFLATFALSFAFRSASSRQQGQPVDAAQQV